MAPTDKRITTIRVLYDGYAFVIAYELMDSFLGRKFDVRMIGNMYIVPYISASDRRCYLEVRDALPDDIDFVTPYVSNRRASRSVHVACASILRALSVVDAPGKRYPAHVFVDTDTGKRYLVINFRRSVGTPKPKKSRPRRLSR